MQHLRFLHIPKTAGTTFTQILKNQYKGQAIFQFTGDIKSNVKSFNELSVKAQNNIALYTGHAPFRTGLQQVDDIEIITFLRDPVKRVMSFCQHVSEGKSGYLLDKFPPDNFNLSAFLRAPIFELNNLQTKMLVNKGASAVDFKMPADEALERALSHLFNEISAYGLVEYFDESLILFKQKFNWSEPLYQKQNCKNHSKLINFTDEHIARIKQLNDLDIKLYNKAKDHFLTLINDPSFNHKAVLRLQRRNQKHKPNYFDVFKNRLGKLYKGFTE